MFLQLPQCAISVWSAILLCNFCLFNCCNVWHLFLQLFWWHHISFHNVLEYNTVSSVTHTIICFLNCYNVCNFLSFSMTHNPALLPFLILLFHHHSLPYTLRIFTACSVMKKTNWQIKFITKQGCKLYCWKVWAFTAGRYIRRTLSWIVENLPWNVILGHTAERH